MKILNYLIVFIIFFEFIIAADLCLSNPKKKELGQICYYSSDCQYPLWCGGDSTTNKTCIINIENGKRCELTNQCAPGSVCFNAICKDILYIGDECNAMTSYCSNSRCILGKCSIIDVGGICIENSQCQYGNYCELSTGKCIPLELDNASCKDSSNCQLSHSCTSGKCIMNFQKTIGTSCNSTRECQVFKGHICDDQSKKCKVYSQLLKPCKDSTECGSNGMCMCKSEGNNVCVDLTVGALSNEKCSSTLSSFSKCMTRERCTENTKKGCPKCYSIWMCYQYECFYMNQFFRSTQNYYKSFCTKLNTDFQTNLIESYGNNNLNLNFINTN